jgi:hypothetical protein
LTLSAVPVSLSAYARITPIRANIGGSLLSAEQQHLHCWLPFVGIPFGSLVMYWAASRNVRSGCFRPGNMIGSTNRLSQDTNLHLPLIGGATREYGTGSKHFSKC